LPVTWHLRKKKQFESFDSENIIVITGIKDKKTVKEIDSLRFSHKLSKINLMVYTLFDKLIINIYTSEVYSLKNNQITQEFDGHHRNYFIGFSSER